MAYTLAQLQTAIQDYCQNSETTFVTNIDSFIRNTEEIILNSVDLDLFRKNATANFTTSNKYLAKPSDYLASFSLAVTVSSVKSFLHMKDVNFIQEINTSGATGVPKYYAPFDKDNFIVAPTPDSGYAVELHYQYRPASLADAGSSGTTWLSTNAPMAMLYGCLVEAYGFMKGEQDIMAHYKEMFTIALGRLKDLGEARENTDAYRTGLPTRARS